MKEEELDIDFIDTEMLQPIFDVMDKIGWDCAIPLGGGPEDDGRVAGMIIGEPAYVEYVLKHLDE